LEGISASNSGQAIIAVPAGGMFIDGGDDFGDFLAAQILVQNVTGEVNLINLTVDATGNNVASGTNIVGVFYQNSSGTVNRLVIRNQSGNGLGMGVWLEGGSANPAVTVENNSLQGFDNTGIEAETSSASSVVTATIKGNDLAGTVGNSTGIILNYGATASVSSNLITGSLEGVLIDGGQGSVSANKVVSTGIGIDIETNGASVSSNTIYNSGSIGILANSTVAPVTGNIIAQSPIGVSFNCTAGNNVHSNTILDATFGRYEITTAGSPNTYYNVSNINGGGC
jgi:hypothetical protein